MGNRVSVEFRQKVICRDGKSRCESSPVLFSHWGGMAFVDEVREYVDELIKEEGRNGGGEDPLARFEPGTLMVDLVRYLSARQSRVRRDLYLGRNQNDGDNTDNGHFVIDVPDGESM